MASLTHVCMWSDKGWKRITASEAARLHPGGGVAASSGLFMCELCGQYVLLTDSVVQVRHFRHSSAEKSKDCPERTFGSGVSITYNAGEHELPIRIRNLTSSDFDLEIGFIQVPLTMLTAKAQIEIRPNSSGIRPFVYLRERLNQDGITYLSIGGTPVEKYAINVTGAAEAIHQFWPKTVQGIDPSGTIFDAFSGKRLVYDADVVVGKKYYLLRRSPVYRTHGLHVSCVEICRKSISLETWRVYEVVANDYDEESARFFLDYHCRLTERPIEIQTVWPIYVENPYVIKHNQKSVVMHVTGNAPTTQVFPAASMRKYTCGDGAVLEIICNSRQQLISAGRTKALQYTYFWQEQLNHTTERPDIMVSDLHDVPVAAGEHDSIPEGKTLRIVVPFDGALNISLNGNIVEKRALHANTPIEIDGIVWNTSLDVYVGLDRIWSASFCHKEKLYQKHDEKIVLQRLKAYAGVQIPVPHTLGSLTPHLIEYPAIRQWLYSCIRSGHMSEKAYRDLQVWITQKNKSVARGGSI